MDLLMLITDLRGTTCGSALGCTTTGITTSTTLWLLPAWDWRLNSDIALDLSEPWSATSGFDAFSRLVSLLCLAQVGQFSISSHDALLLND